MRIQYPGYSSPLERVIRQNLSLKIKDIKIINGEVATLKTQIDSDNTEERKPNPSSIPEPATPEEPTTIPQKDFTNDPGLFFSKSDKNLNTKSHIGNIIDICA